MKKIFALAAVAALTAGVSAYAANPFSDVSQDDWAYQAVSDLSVQGVVEGYPDGTFKGERNMTRYELAQIVARMLAKEDQLNAEQKATLNKLAAEFADELANLGVRVSNLEKKVGNLYWSGDARMQYQRKFDAKKAGDAEHPDMRKSDSWTGRMRINVKAQVNDQVTVNGRFVNEMDFKDGKESSTFMDRINAKWEPNDKTHVTIGRQGVALDQTGTFWDEDGAFDGVVAGYDNGKFGIEAGYGRFKDAYKFEEEGAAYENVDSMEAWYAKLTGHIHDRADVSAFYLKNTSTPNGAITKPEEGSEEDENENKNNGALKGKISVWGVGATVDLGKKFVLDGDYVRTRVSGEGHADLWTAGLTYGAVDTNKVGSWSLGLHYVKAKDIAYLLGNSALDMTDQLDYGLVTSITYEDIDNTEVHFWVAKAGVALQKNVELDAYYNFAAKSSNGVPNPKDTWGVELNYTF